jgi:hypothetical protein
MPWRLPAQLAATPFPPGCRYLHSKGFHISDKGFQGPFLPSSKLEGRGDITIGGGMNLFCVHKTAAKQ